MTVETGIVAFGAYVPRVRLDRSAIYDQHKWFAPGLKGASKGERACANWDEDPVTMAVEAARDGLFGVERSQVKGLSLASTTLPFADRMNAGIVKEALSLPDEVQASDLTGSLRAGLSGLIGAHQAAASPSAQGHTWLSLAADLRKARPASEAELAQGDAAGAMLVGQGPLLARLVGHHSLTIDFVDHFRMSAEEFDYGWESRWIRDEGYGRLAAEGLVRALAAIGVSGAQIDLAAIAIPVRGVPEMLARKAGIGPSALVDDLSLQVGDCGTAHAHLMLASALEKALPGQKILVCAFGQGLDVLVFEAKDALPAFVRAQAQRNGGLAGQMKRGRSDRNYARFLFHRGLLALDRGMRAEADQKQPGSTLYRNRKTVLGLIGGRCTKTGTIQFPASQISVNPNEHAIGTQEDYPLADRPASIITFTADNLAYSPDPPAYYGMIGFEGGGRMIAEFTDIDPAGDAIDVGRAMRMVFRIKAIDETRSFKRYFWKAVPA